MIYLTTGANGAGKTLLTLKDVREQQLKENRPVYYDGFQMDEAKAAEFGWKPFDPPKWQDLPDGSILLWDECQRHMPAGATVKNEPQWLRDIAQFRRARGFDMWLVCPHPSLISTTVRRLIESPSWHRHIKRTLGADLVSEIKFNSPDLRCESAGAPERGEVKMRPYPKEVYTWYRSASLHTSKRRIPKQVYIVAAAVVAVPALFWFAMGALPGSDKKLSKAQASATSFGPAPTTRAAAAPMTAIEYVASHVPRLPGLPHTAPRYDAVTQPTEAPYPAACILMADKCNCYTQQATKLQTPEATCRQIVAGGFFMDWKQQTPPPDPPIAKQDVGGPAKAGDGGNPHAEPVALAQASPVGEGPVPAPAGGARGPRSGP